MRYMRKRLRQDLHRHSRELHGTYDSFECAVDAMAPECAHCHCRILGHGVEANGVMFCCATARVKSAKTGSPIVSGADHQP